MGAAGGGTGVETALGSDKLLSISISSVASHSPFVMYFL